MVFQPDVICSNTDNKEKSYWFIFKNLNLLETGDPGDFSLPLIISPEEIGINTVSSVYLGKLDGINLWAAEASEDDDFDSFRGETEHVYKNIREFYPSMSNEIFALALRAIHLKNWNMSWKHCPSCGGSLELSDTEEAKICKECSKIHYTVISPAIIVAVRKGNKLLLAHNNKFPHRIRYSILAGFVEAGESLEETVRREVYEEVGIKVKNIRYFGSQGWPFPHSLMLGFTAEYEAGEIKVDGVEIGHADWFSADEMPGIPPYGSISRLLIEDFRKNYG